MRRCASILVVVHDVRLCYAHEMLELDHGAPYAVMHLS